MPCRIRCNFIEEIPLDYINVVLAIILLLPIGTKRSSGEGESIWRTIRLPDKVVIAIAQYITKLKDKIYTLLHFIVVKHPYMAI